VAVAEPTGSPGALTWAPGHALTMSNARNSHERGSATIELVYVLPILLLVFLAVVELSRAWLAVTITTAAAREGARVGATTPTTGGGTFNATPAYTTIDNILAGGGLSTGASRTVTCSAPCQPGSQVQAQVTVQFHTIAPAILPALTSVTLRETAVMRYE